MLMSFHIKNYFSSQFYLYELKVNFYLHSKQCLVQST